MKKTMNEMENTLERLKDEKRRNSVVLQGLKVDTNNQNDLKKTMEDFKEKDLNVEDEVMRIAKLGDKTFKIEGKRKVIHSGPPFQKKKTEIQQQIRMVTRKERENGKGTEIGLKKLWIGTKEWKWDKEESKLKKVSKPPNSKIMRRGKKLQRWRQYFKEMLNKETNKSQKERQEETLGNETPNNEEINIPTREEVIN
ncbi:hypothetical protein ILUMI_11070 [Ignelater luminosus]|uniref:Uncharacterized protein n=1 Tax=Ignelater luminosus TaxID=2038154 RepID=A0A8K0CZ53_IGNLU|nr:hypothetical protein ILUMI_11070 [Ignelater luminosus]